MRKSILLLIAFFILTGVQAQKAVPANYDTTGFRYRIMYEIFMRSFADGDRDGIGDFKGIAEQLDYLSSLGIQGLWLTPFNKATSYHKYDVEDYWNVDPEYGTMADLKSLIREAHSRNIKVIMDLVINHCSSQHPWFIEACKDKSSAYRAYFVWQSPSSITSEPDHWHIPPGADTTARDFQKYYGFFWSGMPDLNFDNPAVRAEMIKIGRYWLETVGIDGFRLDAAQHIYPEGQEPKNYAWWREFRSEMEKVKPDFFMVGEVANTNEAVAPYLNGGMHAAFNFDLAKDINQDVLAGKDNGLVNRLLAVRNLYSSFSSDFIDATFIGNHDQNRVMSTMKGDALNAKLAAAVLLTLPGSPYVYYGEEVGMMGQKPDELIREPMPWSYRFDDFTRTRWEKPEYTVQQQVIGVDRQIIDPSSMYSYYRKLIRLRLNSEALRFGDLSAVKCDDPRILAYVRSTSERDRTLVLHNLSDDVVMFSTGSIPGSLTAVFSSDKLKFGDGTVLLTPKSSGVFLIK